MAEPRCSRRSPPPASIASGGERLGVGGGRKHGASVVPHPARVRTTHVVDPPRQRAGGYRYPPSVPLVDGTSPFARASIATAARKARARPLKHDSAIW